MTHELICLQAASVCRKKRVSNEVLARRLDALERTYERQFEMVLELLTTRVPRRKPIGFLAGTRKKRKVKSPKEGG
jgi:hypothetical protein